MCKYLLIFSLVIIAISTNAQVWKEYYDSAAFNWDNDWKKVNKYLERSAEIVKQDLGILDPHYPIIMNDLAIAKWEINEHATAHQLFNYSLELKQKIFGINNEEYVRSIINNASFYFIQEHFDKSLSFFRKSENILRTTGDSLVLAYVLTDIGNILVIQDKNDSAQQYYEEALSIFVRFPQNYSNINRTRILIAKCENRKGNIDKAVMLLEKIISISSLRQEADLYANALNELGLALSRKNDFSSAKKVLRNSLHLEDLVEKSTYLTTLHNLALIEVRIGQFNSAAELFEKALQLAEENNGRNSLLYVNILNNYISVLQEKQQFKEAEEKILGIVNFYTEKFGPDHHRTISALNNLAVNYRNRMMFPEAIKLYHQIMNYEAEPLAKTKLFHNLGVALLQLQKYDSAEYYLSNSLKLKEELLSPFNIELSSTLNHLALLYTATNNIAKAEIFYIRAVENQKKFLSNIFPYLSEQERRSLYRTIKNDLERFNSFALRHADKNPVLLSQMLNLHLATKSILLKNNISLKKRVLQSGDSTLLLYYNQWFDSRQSLSRLYGAAQTPQVKSEIQQLQRKAEKTEQYLAEQAIIINPHLKEQNWTDIQAKLNPEEVAVAIIRFREFEINDQKEEVLQGFTGNIYYAALIIEPGKKSPEVVNFSNGRKMEGRLYNYYRNAILFEVEDIISYETYWFPIEKRLSDKKKIYFSPDGVYNKMNIHTLLNKEKELFLINEKEIHVLLNLMDIHENPSNQKLNEFVLIGDPLFDPRENGILKPLPGTHREINYISDLLKSKGLKASIHLKEKASEKLIHSLDNPSVLHIATHGYFLDYLKNLNYPVDEEPLLNSGIMLANAGLTLTENSTSDEYDGILTAYEVLNLDLLETDLVVLSACETGLGNIENGEGVFGLQSAFLTAGAKNILISLWKIDDEITSELMRSIYKYYLDGIPIREALIKAQREIKELYFHPYYWGSFYIVGE